MWAPIHSERFRSMHSGWTMHSRAYAKEGVGWGVGGGYSVCTIIHVVLGYMYVGTCMYIYSRRGEGWDYAQGGAIHRGELYTGEGYA